MLALCASLAQMRFRSVLAGSWEVKGTLRVVN